jgi:hypothetical protein
VLGIRAPFLNKIAKFDFKKKSLQQQFLRNTVTNIRDIMQEIITCNFKSRYVSQIIRVFFL